MCETIKRVITHGGRIPHFQQDFPLILFWSHRSGCTSFANWFFYQIGLYAEAIQYDPFIHYYEFQVYKSETSYYEKLEKEVLQLKKILLSWSEIHLKEQLAHFYCCMTTLMQKNNGKALNNISIMTKIVIKEYLLNNSYIT
ncbi:hypothetical protein IKG_02176 [Bacillus cereus VD200]|nr:hypothetical protein IKG_02176 [Bacillus cereus VD200]